MSATAPPSPVSTPTGKVPARPRRVPRDGDRGHTRAQRSERTAQLLHEAATCDDVDDRVVLLHEVVLLNRGVAEAVASRYRNRGVAEEDLHQTAFEGLTKAVWRFDPALRHDLLTYAVPTIRGELRRHFRDHGWAIRPPRPIQELQARINLAAARLGQQLGRDPVPDEVVADLGITMAEYDEAVLAFGCYAPPSLDTPLTSESSATAADLLADPHDQQSAAEARVLLAPVMRRLGERDRRILYLRFFEDRTQAQIGEELGVTQMQISRLLSRLLVRLRDEISERPPES